MEQERLARRAAVAIGMSLALIAGIGVGTLYLGLTRFNHPALSQFPVQGIDVSHHQGEIDWARMAQRPRLRFAYIKASEGATLRDPRFIANWSGASRAGVVPGAYHFFTLCRSGVKQAENFVGAMAQVRGPMLPPAVNLEFGGNCSKRPTQDVFRAELLAFSVVVESALRCRPIFYVTPEFHGAYVAGRLDGPAIWLRNIYRMSEGRGEDWLFWQFANRGRMKGVTGFVDLDVFHGNTADFERLQCDRHTPSSGRSI
ncbi:lysozyme [Panacagrimonas perspica]|uniref:Lysozyme n=1 Tax=Panacagrimonas perspica TaxID=381431 RepID=A0A4R7PDI7_9GAMM|nr:GH25 family lysozyme [Panacagrimonas perspica]TDU32147.1 lysozyme [Panacagrimonas perspica]THD01150.1 hypothetical protein B1810_21410 [Panacagrimonas perspica]